MKKTIFCTALIVSLALLLFATAFAQVSEESIFISPLWEFEKFREQPEEDEPSREFVPNKPERGSWTMMLSKKSQYQAMGGEAGADVDQAFYHLGDDLTILHKNIRELFSHVNKYNSPYFVTDQGDPNCSSVAIVVEIKYPYAGAYAVHGTIRAYNCELTLTAYNMITHEFIAELTLGNY